MIIRLRIPSDQKPIRHGYRIGLFDRSAPSQHHPSATRAAADPAPVGPCDPSNAPSSASLGRRDEWAVVAPLKKSVFVGFVFALSAGVMCRVWLIERAARKTYEPDAAQEGSEVAS